MDCVSGDLAVQKTSKPTLAKHTASLPYFMKKIATKATKTLICMKFENIVAASFGRRGGGLCGITGQLQAKQ